jgi:hypothetical protein
VRDPRNSLVGRIDHKGLAYRSLEDLEDQSLVRETNLAFCRVNVYIESLWRNSDIEYDDRETPGHDQRVVGLLDGEVERPVIDPAPVDGDEHLLAIAPGDGR